MARKINLSHLVRKNKTWNETLTPTVGDIVKVRANEERFWCIVKEITGNMVHGTIDNDLVSVPDMLGASIRFPMNAILEIYPSKPTTP